MSGNGRIDRRRGATAAAVAVLILVVAALLASRRTGDVDAAGDVGASDEARVTEVRPGLAATPASPARRAVPDPEALPASDPVAGEAPKEPESPEVVLRLRTSEGIPVAGFDARVLTSVPGRVQRPLVEGATDADGELPLGRPSAGPYLVELVLPTTDEDCGLWAPSPSIHFTPFEVTGEAGADGVERIERTIPPFVRLAVRVSFADGEPIECAAVGGVVWGADDGQTLEPEVRAAVRTDLDGRAAFTLPRSGVLHLSAGVRPGAGSISEEVDLATVPDGHTVEFVWDQEKGVPFRGRLRWPSGAGANGALGPAVPSVLFVEFLRPTDGSATADAVVEPRDGRFEVFGLQPGDHLIRAAHPGVRPTLVHLPPAGIVDYVYVPDVARSLVSPSGSVGGWDELRARDPELGSWWEVSLTHAEWPSVRRVANVVVPDGADTVEFSFADLMPGDYRMSIAPPFGSGDAILEASLPLAELPTRPRFVVDLRDSSVRRGSPREE